jgi:hypothetical protein
MQKIKIYLIRILSFITFYFISINYLFSQANEPLMVLPGPIINEPIPDSSSNTRKIPPNYLNEMKTLYETAKPLASSFTVSSKYFVIKFIETPPSNVIEVINAAINIWSEVINTRVPINISVSYRSLGPSTLGNAGPSFLYANFANAPLSGIFYPIATAESLAGFNLNGDQPDINVNINSDFSNFYIGLGVPSSNQYDLLSVLLHEIGHGLGIIGGITQGSNANTATYSVKHVFDYNLCDSNSKFVFSSPYLQETTSLYNLITSSNLFFSGKTTLYNLGKNTPLNAPSNYSSGSSVYHVNPYVFRVGDINSFMVPALAAGEINRTISPVIKSLLNDAGWNLGVTPPVVRNQGINVSEDGAEGISAAVVSAIDNENQQMTHKIVKGNLEGAYTISPSTGAIFIKRVFDPKNTVLEIETSDFYYVTKSYIIINYCEKNLSKSLFNRAKNFFSDSFMSSTSKLNNTSSINFEAPKYIQLNPGFEASSGTRFKAAIGAGCPASF